MKYREILLESPISDMHFMGGTDSFPPIPDANIPFDKGTSFGKVDKALLQSEKGRNKIIKSFSRTPFDFEIYFINHNDIDGDYAEPIKNKSVGNGNYSKNFSYNRNNILKVSDSYQTIKGEPGKIKVVMLSNTSDTNKMPMNGWTLAHKISHGIQDSGDESMFFPYSEKILAQLRNIMKSETSRYQLMHQSDISYEVRGLGKKLTMKSARNGLLDKGDYFEQYAEILAQYLIKGEVTLKLRTSKAKEQVPLLNALIKNLFEQLVGKVVVEI